MAYISTLPTPPQFLLKKKRLSSKMENNLSKCCYYLVRLKIKVTKINNISKHREDIYPVKSNQCKILVFICLCILINIEALAFNEDA